MLHVHDDRRKNEARSLILAWALALLGLLTVILPTSVRAQTYTYTPPAHTKGWCTVTATPGSGCYATPQQACERQHADFADDAIYHGAFPSSNWYEYDCSWGPRPGDPLPAPVYFNCDGNPDYQREPPGYCTQYDLTNCNCDQNYGANPNEWTAHPINIMSGAKRFTDNDFTSADGSLKFDRTFVSLPNGGLTNAVVTLQRSLANWYMFFDVSLQFGNWTGSHVVAVLNADGTAGKYQRQSDGSFAPFTSDYYHPIASTDATLQFVGTWPSNLDDLTKTASEWVLTDAESNIWTLQTYPGPSNSGYLVAHPVSVQRPDGTVLTFTYDTDNALTTITDQAGKTVTVNWNKLVSPSSSAAGTVASLTLPGGYSVRYTYQDEAGNTTTIDAARLAKVEYLDALGVVQDSTSYGYDNTSFPTFVTEIEDSTGNVRWQASYNNDGTASYSAGPGGAYAESVSYTVVAPSFTRTRTDALGRQTVYNYITRHYNYAPMLTEVDGIASTHAPATTRTNTFDSNYYMTSSTDENGNTTQYTRNGKGQPTEIVEAYGAAAARTTNITWDANFGLPDQIVQNGLTTNYTYDGQGRLTSRTEVDTTTTTVPYSTNGQTRTWTYTWGTTGAALGKLVSIDGPLAGTGDTTSFTYNSEGYLASITDEVGHVTTVTAWDWRGAPLTVVDPNGVSTTFTYDIHGRPLTTTVNPGTSQSQFAFSYDIVGNLTQITLPTGGFLQYTYDSASRVTQVANDKGETIALTPDAMGNVTQSTVKDASGAIRQQESTVYDELGRLIQTIGAASTTPTTFAYDKLGNPTSTVDGRGKTWSNSFDQLNRLVTATNPESQSVNLGYDIRDNLTDHKDARNLETTRVTDGFGDVISETSPDRGTRTYGYDNAGNMTKRVDGDGVETDFTYDNAGRLLTETFPGATAENMTFTYDGTASGNDGVGRLTGVSEQSGSSAFTFDARGRVTKDEKVIQSRTYDVSYAYDGNGKVTTVTLPSGRIVNFSRDADGLVTGITTQPGATGTAATVASAISYSPFGPLTSLTYGNGLVLTKSYNANYWLTRIQVTGAATPTLDLGYQRFDDGGLKEIDDNAGTGRTVTMSTSDSGRLTAATGPWGAETYAWDANGNRTQDTLTVGGTTTTTNAVVDSASNRVTRTTDALGATQRTLTYRAGGDLATDALSGGSTFNYIYNARKRLAEITQDGLERADYGYDFRDQRVWRKIVGVTSTTIHYIFDEQGHLLAEHDGSTGVVLREYVWIDDTPIAVIDSTSGSPVTYYIHAGQLDEPQVMTDASQATIWNAYMSPFGQAQVFTSGSAVLDLRLPGQWFQAEAAGSGLNQNNHRDYDPSLGRYIEADPRGVNAGPNPYAYVDGKVFDLADFWGLQVDLNLFPQNQDIYNNASHDQSPFPSTFTVGVHSNGVVPIDSHHQIVTPAQMALLIQRNPKYKPGVAVTLAACRLGNSVYIQSLANILHAPVTAPKGYAWYPSDGGTIYSAGMFTFHWEFPTTSEPWVTANPAR